MPFFQKKKFAAKNADQIQIYWIQERFGGTQNLQAARLLPPFPLTMMDTRRFIVVIPASVKWLGVWRTNCFKFINQLGFPCCVPLLS
jgi:hypothetical protein